MRELNSMPKWLLCRRFGKFEPRKPLIDGISTKTRNQIFYQRSRRFRDKRWSSPVEEILELEYLLTMSLQRWLWFTVNGFRGALDSVEKVQIKDAGKIRMITPAEVVGLNGCEHIESIDNRENGAQILLYRLFYSAFWSYAKVRSYRKLGTWNWEKNAIKVNNSLDYQTNIPGFAIGDVNTYPGKLNWFFVVSTKQL
jgi:thioredoxin reductase (NADPH)